MRLPFWAVLAGAPALFPSVTAGPSTGGPAASSPSPSPSPSPKSSASIIIAKLPPCAIPCIASAVANSTCSPDDIPCLCADKTANEEGTTCVEARCSFSDGLSTKNATQTACQAPIRDRSAEFNNTVIALGVIAIFITATRLAFKQFVHPAKALGADDWAILGTLVICVAGLVIVLRGMTANGLGRDVWTVTPAQISRFVLYFYVMEILYLAGISLVKLSISLFYLRLFAATVRPAVLRATVAFNLLYGLIFVTGAIFQCIPVDFYWEQFFDPAEGACININLYGWLNAAIGLAIDLWMIALPMSQVLPLRLHWKKKVGVAIMFLLGTFVTVVSALRLQSLIHFAKSDNPTWDQWTTAYWSIIEINVGMICSCLPTLRLILVRLAPETFGSANRTPHLRELRSTSRTEASRTKEETDLQQRYVVDLEEG
ncbi:Extracellular membrane protein, CFEM domain protein [Metarhizium brunneum]